MTKENKSLKVKTSSRRKFFKTAAKAGAVAAATVAMPNIAHAAPVTLKMQAAWPSGANIFFEMAGDYAKMVATFSQEVVINGAIFLEVLTLSEEFIQEKNLKMI